MTNKKQAFNLIESICYINEKVWNNAHGSYDAKKEAAYPIEEALEGFKNLDRLDFDVYEYSPKEVSREIVAIASGDEKIEDVDAFDKHLDIIYFSIGSLHKLGLTPPQIVEGLQAVHDANCAKIGEKDAHGKITKDKSFVNPEPVLQKILDQRPSL